MRISKHLQRLIGWMSACAILLAALAPALSHALASGSYTSSSWQALCSTAVKTINDSVDQKELPAAPDQHGAGHFLDHCPFCATHAHAWAIWPSQLAVISLSTQGSTLPLLFTQARRTLFAWATPLSRAPPVIS